MIQRLLRFVLAEMSRPIAVVAIVALFPIMLFALLVANKVVIGAQGQSFDDYVLEFFVVWTPIVLVLEALVVGLTAMIMVRRKRHRSTEPIVVGGLYASHRGDGSFSVVKVLVLEETTVHLRLYANRFEQFPQDLDPWKLTLGTIHDKHFGVGHVPLERAGFTDRYTFIQETQLRDDELDGYRCYLEQTLG